jgi:DNA repair protein RecN (Recombination protein N)
MLKELHLRNLAIVDEAHLTFGSGLSVLTGETGAGKSIIVEALGLLLGDRATAELVRTGAEEAAVEGVFSLDGPSSVPLRSLLGERGAPLPEGEDLFLKRIVSRGSKSRAYLNGSPVPAGLLNEIRRHLADIHGQHEQQELLSADYVLDLLDGFAGLHAEREAVARHLAQAEAQRLLLHTLQQEERDRTQREEFLRFQRQEIDAAAPRPGEDQEAEEERRVLAHTERLLGHVHEALERLHGAPSAVLGEIQGVHRRIREAASVDARLAEHLPLLESAAAQVDTVARALREYAAGLAADPQRLTFLEDRLDALGRLKKKYGPTLEAVLAFHKTIGEELERLERRSEEIPRVEAELQQWEDALTQSASLLSRKRETAARNLERQIRAGLGEVGLGKGSASVRVERAPLTPRGADRAEVLVSFNPDEDPKPLARVASGGELSRIMLVLKQILAAGDRTPTLVFDEVDAGIGGRVAEVVGERLRALAAYHQVFCITHLPQIASQAHAHYRVEKGVAGKRTWVRILRLDPRDRVEEVARMLGGKVVTEQARRHAADMLRRVQQDG